MPADDNLRRTFIGKTILNMGDVFSDPLGTASRGMYVGSLDCTSPTGTILRCRIDWGIQWSTGGALC